MHLHAIDQASVAVVLDYPEDSPYPQGQHPDHELEAAVIAQLADARISAEHTGKSVRVVRCADKLAVDMKEDPRTLQVIARAIYKFDPAMLLACKLDRLGVQVAHDCGVRVVAPEAMTSGVQQPPCLVDAAS